MLTRLLKEFIFSAIYKKGYLKRKSQMRNTDTIVKAGKKKVREYIADSDTPFSVPKALSKPKIGYYTYFYQNNRRFLTFLQFDPEQGLFYMTARYTPDKYHLIKELSPYIAYRTARMDGLNGLPLAGFFKIKRRCVEFGTFTYLENDLSKDTFCRMLKTLSMLAEKMEEIIAESKEEHEKYLIQKRKQYFNKDFNNS